MVKKANIKIWIGLFISALFLFLALYKADLRRTWQIMAGAEMIPLLGIILITFFQFIIRAWRWDILLIPIKRVRFSNRLTSILIGFAANCVFPARIGELIRAKCLGKLEQIKGGAALGTIVVERLFDGFTLLLILLIGLLNTDFPDRWAFILKDLQRTGLVLFALYILIIVFIAGFQSRTSFSLKTMDRILFFIPGRLRKRLVEMTGHLSQGLVMGKNPGQWGQVILYSFLLWTISLWQIIFINSSLDIKLPFISIFIIMSMAAFGVMIPSAPGYIGTFHISVQYGYMFYGIGREEGLSAAVLLHFALILPTICYGVGALIYLRLFPTGTSDRDGFMVPKR